MVSLRKKINAFDFLYYDDIPFTLYLFVQVTGLKMCALVNLTF